MKATWEVFRRGIASELNSLHIVDGSEETTATLASGDREVSRPRLPAQNSV